MINVSVQFSLSSLTANVSGHISTFATMFISFTNGWKMTLVVLAGLPIISYAKSVQNDDAEETNEDESDGVSYACMIIMMSYDRLYSD